MTTATLKKTFHWGWLTVQRFSPLSSWQETWQCAGRHGAGGAESSMSRSEGSQERTIFYRLGGGGVCLFLTG